MDVFDSLEGPRSFMNRTRTKSSSMMPHREPRVIEREREITLFIVTCCERPGKRKCSHTINVRGNGTKFTK